MSLLLNLYFVSFVSRKADKACCLLRYLAKPDSSGVKTQALKTGVNLFLASVLLLSRWVALCDEGLCALGDPIACQAHSPPTRRQGHSLPHSHLSGGPKS